MSTCFFLSILNTYILSSKTRLDLFKKENPKASNLDSGLFILVYSVKLKKTLDVLDPKEIGKWKKIINEFSSKKE